MTTPKTLITADLKITEEIETAKTYQMADRKIQGYIDGLDALKQSIYKVLHTEKYEWPIYSFSYGIEWESLIGKEDPYVKVELKRRIQECLLQDNRIVSVDNFEFAAMDDNMVCTFDVNSIYGTATITKEVNT